MEDTARLFIVLIGFCFLIVFVVWIFIAFSKTRVVLDSTNEAQPMQNQQNTRRRNFQLMYAQHRLKILFQD